MRGERPDGPGAQRRGRRGRGLAARPLPRLRGRLPGLLQRPLHGGFPGSQRPAHVRELAGAVQLGTPVAAGGPVRHGHLDLGHPQALAANTVYALDSTTIDLCLSLFPWADFRSTKAAVKMHTLLDLRGPIPSFIHVSDGKMGDAAALDLIVPEAGAIYVMDRGYVDFRRLHALHQAGAFFVTRTKINMNYHRVYSRAVDKTTGVCASINPSRSTDSTRDRSIRSICAASVLSIRKPANDLSF